MSTPDDTARPRLSFGTWALAFGPFEKDPWSFERIARYAADAGYQGVEINGFRPHPHQDDYADAGSVAPLRELLGSLGLDVSGYAPDLTQTPPATSTPETYLAAVDAALRFCRLVGAPALRIDTVSPPGPFDEQRFAQLVTTWRASALRAADVGVLLLWEFEPGFWLNRPSEVVQLLSAVDQPNFKVMFDTSHAYMGAVAGARQGPAPEVLPGGVEQYARLLAEWIGHFHITDSDGSLHDDQTSAHLGLGHGRIDFVGVIEAAGTAVTALPWWTVDLCFNATVEEDGRAAVPFTQALIADLGAVAR